MKPIRVNFRAKRIISEKEERLFQKIKEFYLYGNRWYDLKLTPGADCFSDEEIVSYDNSGNAIVNYEFIRKNENHFNECDFCLAKMIKFEHEKW